MRISRTRKAVRSAVAVVLFFSLGLTVGGAQNAGDGSSEQQPQDVGVLLKGPEYGERLPFLQPNAIEHYSGRYAFRDREITVYYTERDILRLEEWESAVCGAVQLYRLPLPESEGQEGPEGWEVYFFRNGSYVLFFGFDGELNCTFVIRFLQRFDYFRSVRNLPSKRPPFPAVVE